MIGSKAAVCSECGAPFLVGCVRKFPPRCSRCERGASSTPGLGLSYDLYAKYGPCGIPGCFVCEGKIGERPSEALL